MKKIYILKDRLDGMEYIGQTCHSLEKRLGDGYKPGTRIREAIDRDGIENFDKEILEDGLTDEQADEREQYYIRTRNTIWPNGLNLESGGKHSKVNEVSKRKISETLTGHEVNNEMKEKISNSLKEYFKNHNSPMLGKSHTEETRQKISQSLQGKIYPSHRKRVLQFTKDGQFIAEYPSQTEASLQSGVSQGNIGMCCRGERKSAGKYIWSFAD